MGLLMVEPLLAVAGEPSGNTNGEVSLTQYGLPFSAVTGTQQSVTRPWNISRVGDWLRCTSFGDGGPYNTRLGIARPFSDLVEVNASSVLFGGFRYRLPAESQVAPTGQICIYDGNNLNSLQPLIVMNNQIPDREYYIEWLIDIPNNKIRRRVDGVDFLPDLVLDASMAGALVGGRARYQYGTSYGVANSLQTVMMDFKDGYVCDKSVDGVMSSWLGPQLVTAVPVLEVDSTFTTSNGASVKDVLNAPFTTDPASRVSPVASSGTDGAPALIHLDTSSLKGRINGVHITVSAMKTPGKLGNLTGALVLDEVSSTPRTMTLVTGVSLFSKVYLGAFAPGGAAWTKELLANSILTLQPIK